MLYTETKIVNWNVETLVALVEMTRVVSVYSVADVGPKIWELFLKLVCLIERFYGVIPATFFSFELIVKFLVSIYAYT
jgi:hypothetical protein